MKVNFKGKNLLVDVFTYDGEDVVIDFQKPRAKDNHYLRATVDLSIPLPEGLVAIKDYSENEGVLEALVKGGIVSEPMHYFPTGYVQVPICKLLVEPRLITLNFNRVEE